MCYVFDSPRQITNITLNQTFLEKILKCSYGKNILNSTLVYTAINLLQKQSDPNIRLKNHILVFILGRLRFKGQKDTLFKHQVRVEEQLNIAHFPVYYFNLQTHY